MAQMQTISTRFPSDTIDRLEEIAGHQNRSRSDLIQEAVDGYLNSFAWFEAEVQKGKDAIAEGRVISHDDVKARLRKLGVKC
jgi:predicted transcriptional regulator